MPHAPTLADLDRWRRIAAELVPQGDDRMNTPDRLSVERDMLKDLLPRRQQQHAAARSMAGQIGEEVEHIQARISVIDKELAAWAKTSPIDTEGKSNAD